MIMQIWISTRFGLICKRLQVDILFIVRWCDSAVRACCKGVSGEGEGGVSATGAECLRLTNSHSVMACPGLGLAAPGERCAGRCACGLVLALRKA